MLIAVDSVECGSSTDRSGEGEEAAGKRPSFYTEAVTHIQQFLVLLRNDLEKVRMLAELVRKREKEKLRQSQVIKDVVDIFIFPHYGKLRLTLEKISA